MVVFFVRPLRLLSTLEFFQDDFQLFPAAGGDQHVGFALQRRVHELIAGNSNWEYAETRWVAADELIAFGEAERTIPPTAQLIPIVAEMLTD